MLKKFFKSISLAAAAVLMTVSLAACGQTIDGTKTAITVNGEEISTGAVAFYTRYQQAGYYTSYQSMISYGLYTADAGIYDAEYSDDQTFGEYMLDEIVSDIEEMAVISQHADDYGYTLSDERKQQITEAAQSFISANKEMISKNGVSQADVEKILQLYTIRTEMKDYMTADVDREVSDEEAAQTTIIYSRISRTNSSDEMTDEEYDELIMGETTQLLEEVKNLEEKTVDTIKEAAQAIDENFLTNTITYGADYEYLDEAVKQAAAGISDGEVFDGVVITDDYYYIVKLEAAFDEEATETQKGYIITDRENERVEELTQEWMEAATIETTDALSQITITDSDVYSVSQE